MKGFTAEDFLCKANSELGEICICDSAAIVNFVEGANALLPALIEAEMARRLSDAETVYCANFDKGRDMWDRNQSIADKHKAKLLAVTEIGKPWPWEKKE